MRCDVCTFVKQSRYPDGRIKRMTSIAIPHVDDLLIAANEEGLSLFKKVIAQYRTGDLMSVDENHGIAYSGLEIGQDANGRFGLRQAEYISKLDLVTIADVIRNNAFAITEGRWETSTKQIAGSVIRANQTRLGGCAISTHLSTSALDTVGNVQLTLEFI